MYPFVPYPTREIYRLSDPNAILFRKVRQEGDKYVVSDPKEEYVLTPTIISDDPHSSFSRLGNRDRYYDPTTDIMIKSRNPYDLDWSLPPNFREMKRIHRHLHYKFLDKWLYEDFPELFDYIVVDNDKTRLVRNDDERRTNIGRKSTASDMEKKVDFIEDEFFDMSTSKKILKKILRDESLRWGDLPHEQRTVKYAFADFLKKKIKKEMRSH